MKPKLIQLLAVGAGLLLLFVLAHAYAPATAQTPPAFPPVVGRNVGFGVSRPVADLPLDVGPARGEAWPRRTPPERQRPKSVTTPAPVPARPGATSAPDLPIPGVSFDGLSNADNGAGTTVTPPDPNGDVGPNHYVQIVNFSFAIYSKTGAQLQAPRRIHTLFGGLPNPSDPCKQPPDQGDPIALYDPLADRWLISQFAIPNDPNPPYYQCIAISQTGDPAGSYNLYSFIVSNSKFNDYPKLGVWPDGYYMTANQYGNASPSGAWAGQGVWVFDRAKMLLGLPATFQYFDLFGVDPRFGNMLPGDFDGTLTRLPPAGAPNSYMEVDDGNASDPSNFFPTDSLRVWYFHVDWLAPANTTFGLAGQPNVVLNTAPFDSNMCNYQPSCIPQPPDPVSGIQRRLDAISDRLMYRLQYRNFGDHESLVGNHTVDVDGTNHAGIRWYELRKSDGGPWEIYQQGTYAPDAAHRWMGSAAMDAEGNLAIGYSVSSGTLFPSIRYASRVAADPPGTLPQPEGTIIDGAGSQLSSGSRWGDYSSLSVDPSDDCTFWYTNEYYAVSSSTAWRTRIGSFRFPGCNAPPNSSPTPTFTPTPTPTASFTPTATPTGQAFQNYMPVIRHALRDYMPVIGAERR
jgi:hypothetical protein